MPTFEPVEVSHDGIDYEIIVPSINLNKEVLTAEDLADVENETKLAAALGIAWKGQRGARTVEDFDNNGVFTYEGETEVETEP